MEDRMEREPSNLVEKLAALVVGIDFQSLSPAVIHEIKRLLLDAIGCALGGVSTEKGKISIQFARRLGGPPESSIIGVGTKVSCANAAFANGELMNALDYDSLLFPGGHVPPNVIPAPLAVAESVGASGKDLILATAIAFEFAVRISRALTLLSDVSKGSYSEEYLQEGVGKEDTRKYASVYGYGQHVFGGTAGISKILKFDVNRISQALGIAGHICTVRPYKKWADSTVCAMTKYGSAGWISTGAVSAALLAEMGYIGDTTVFDGDFGFWRFAGSDQWEPKGIMDGIGERWLFLETVYKAYPCCGAMHTALDCLASIVDKNNLMPGDIESVNVLCDPLVELPLWANNQLTTQVDTQFNVPYVMAAVAHRIRPGPEWQDMERVRDPKMLEFMKKVTFRGYPGYKEAIRKDPRISFAAVEVRARGQTFSEERKYPKGTPYTEAAFSDEELVAKFRHNASRILTVEKTNKAVEALLELEKVENISELAQQIAL